MDYILLILGIALIVIGFLGSFLPVLPGPPLSWAGLLCLHFIDKITLNPWILWGSFIAMLIITVLDYIIPAQGTKRFGGSNYGVWGTNIGLIVGIFAPIPAGFILGPFIGAFVGEMIYNSDDITRALKAAIGSFIGFLVGTFIKIVYCLIMLGLFLYYAWDVVF